MVETQAIVVLDFGAQYSQLIARRIRELNVFSVVLPCNTSLEEIQSYHPAGIVLSGGPSSVYDTDAPPADERALHLGVPVLGICYGLQFMVYKLGGKVRAADKREYGHSQVELLRDDTALFKSLRGPLTVWMSHGDEAMELPPGFELIGTTSNAVAAIQSPAQKWYAVQFHPEVHHTPQGTQILRNFVFEICGLKPNWTPQSFIDETVASVRQTVGKGRVICGLSGGVDSSVAAELVDRAIGDQLTCIFVNNGVLRKNEFIAVFEEEAHRIEQLRGKVEWLVQGTLYPDVIESRSVRGPSQTIKSHHNVGGLPDIMKLKLIEPLKDLFKDEVRKIGRDLGMPEELLQRQPFPGPGLAVRIVGEVTPERVALLQEADDIVVTEIKKAGLYNKVWQSFAVLLPVMSVGVMGDMRTYAYTCAIRAVHSEDGMTADWVPLPHEVLKTISNRIVNEVKGINRVVYDVTSKPPGTIEWE